MAGHRFCVHVVAAGFVAAAGSLALADLSAVASAEPDGGGAHGSAGSRDSGKGHSSSGGGQHSAGSSPVHRSNPSLLAFREALVRVGCLRGMVVPIRATTATVVV